MRSYPFSWTSTLSKLGFRRSITRRRAVKAPSPRRASFETLEARHLLSITVNTLIDENDGYNVGNKSLREALAEAASITGTDVIDFSPELAGTMRLEHGELYIASDVTINGPGVDRLTINARGKGRVFDIAASKSVSIGNVTISGGKVSDNGGGVYNAGILTLDSVAIVGNRATGGGGLYSGDSSSVEIRNSTIADNVANWGGGALLQDGTVIISASTFSGNRAAKVDALSGSGTGGGLYLEPYYGTAAEIANSTFSGNFADDSAGALLIDDGSTSIVSSTIAFNGAEDGVAGGLWVVSGSVYVHNSIVALNTVPGGGANSDVFGALNTGSSYNIFYAGDGSSDLSGSTLHNQIQGDDPKLSELGFFGGPTKTHALLAGSPAIDKGKGSLTGEAADQRGVRRIIDRSESNAGGGDGIDIGATEAGIVVTTLVDESISNSTISLREALAAASAAGTSAAPFRIEFSPNLVGGVLTLSGELSIDRSVQIVGLGAQLLTIDAHDASRVFNVSDGDTTLKNVEIVGLTIENGYLSGNDGGGILSYENLTLRGVRFQGNRAQSGGALRTLAGSLSVIDCTFLDNEASWGGAAALASGSSAVVISGSTFERNHALNLLSTVDDGYGGAIYAVDGDGIEIRDTLFKKNSAYVDGGGVYLGWDVTSAALFSTVFEENEATNSGGGLRGWADNFIVEDSLFTKNEAGWGAGAVLYGRTKTDIARSTFQENEALTRSGLTGSGSGGALYLLGGSSQEPIRIWNSTIAHNEAGNAGGGLVFESAHAELTHDTITLNENAGSAGFYNISSTLNVNNSIVADNDGANYAGSSFSSTGSIFQDDVARLMPWVAVNGATLFIPQLDSAANDAGSTTAAHNLALISDQRGDGYRRQHGDSVDAGAIEAPFVLDDSEDTLTLYGSDLPDSISAGDSGPDFVLVNGILQSVDNLSLWTISIFGYAGDDTIDLGQSWYGDATIVWCGQGDDVVRGSYASDTVYGEAGDDTLDGGTYALSDFNQVGDDLHGGDGDDLLTAGGFETLETGTGSRLSGGSGDDILTGSLGGDDLDGGDDEDILVPFGGAGDVPTEVQISLSSEIDEGDSVSPTLTWNGVTDDAYIEWGDGSEETLVTPTGGPYSHEYENDSSLAANGQFAYRIRYVHDGDTVVSAPKYIKVRSLDLSPPRITSVSGTAQTNSLTWEQTISANSSITAFSYELQRSRSGLDGSWDADGTVTITNGNSLPYSTGQDEHTYAVGFAEGKYYFRMRSVYSGQHSAWSNPVATSAFGDETVVRVTAMIEASPFKPAVVLSWPDELALRANAESLSYRIDRKLPLATSWTPLAFVRAAESNNSFTDHKVAPGTTYEYRVTRTVVDASQPKISSGVGYVAVGVDVSPMAHEQRGAVELMIDSRFATSLEFEIAQLIDDLVSDGWKVNDHLINVAMDTVHDVRALIQFDFDNAAQTTDASDDVRTVLLLGHIPVPYSGWANPDNHGARAFPSDVFYGDIDGEWLDADANIASENPHTGNMNLRSDGVLDPNVVPQDGDLFPVELSVGRVDMNLMANFDNEADYTGSGEWQEYTIPVGQAYTGLFDTMSFVSGDASWDETSQPTRTNLHGTTEFTDIVLTNFKRNGALVESEELSIADMTLHEGADTPGFERFGYDGSLSASSYDQSGDILTLTGDAWKVASIEDPNDEESNAPLEILPQTVLTLKMRYGSELNVGKVRPWNIAVGFDQTSEPLQGYDEFDTQMDIDRAIGVGGGFQHISEDFTFRLHSEPNKGWGARSTQALKPSYCAAI